MAVTVHIARASHGRTKSFARIAIQAKQQTVICAGIHFRVAAQQRATRMLESSIGSR